MNMDRPCIKNERKGDGKTLPVASKMADRDSLRKTNGKATGRENPPHCVENDQKCDGEELPPPSRIENKRQRSQFPILVASKSNANGGVSHPRCIEIKCQRRGFPIHVASKTKGNAPPFASKMDRKAMERRKPSPDKRQPAVE